MKLLEIFVLIGVVLVIIINILNFIILFALQIEFPIITIDNQINDSDINYSQIVEEVTNLEKEYFEFKNTKINISFGKLNNDSDNSDYVTLGMFYKEGNKVKIVINEEITNRDEFRAVLTHEYLHFVLYQIGIYNIKNSSYLNEGLTHAFTWYANEEIQTKFEGKKAKRQTYPYTYVIGQIFEQDNFECLDNVFIKSNKIKSIEDYKNRLVIFCNVTF